MMESLPSSRRQTYRAFLASGIVNAVVASLFGPFTIKFLERIGGSEFHISLFNSLPGLIGVAVGLPGALWLAGNRHKNLKTLTAEFTLASRLMVLPLLPLVWMSPKWAPLCCVVLLALKNIPESISQTALQGLAGDMFSSRERTTAISQRSRLSVPATLLVSLLSGVILRIVPGSDAERLTLYQLFFILAALFGLLEVYFLGRMQVQEETSHAPLPSFRSMMGMVFREKAYKRYVLSSLVFYFSWQMGWPLFSIYQVLDMGADELWLSLISVLSAVGMFIGYRFWNKVILKRGNPRAAVYATLGMSVNPLLMLAFPNLYWLTGINMLIGFFTAGTMTVLLNALLEVTPAQHRVVYVGTYNSLVNLSLAISPFVAYGIYHAVGMTLSMVVVSVCRLVGCIAFFLYSRSRSDMPV